MMRPKTPRDYTMIENLDPQQAWDLLNNNSDAVLVDVRTKVEHSFVGHPPGSISIPWKESPDWQVNPQFVAEVKKVVLDRNAPILLLCRSGQRSLDAAKALEEAGYQLLINIVDVLKAPWMSISIGAILADGAIKACLGSRVKLIANWTKQGVSNKNLNSSHDGIVVLSFPAVNPLECISTHHA